MEYSKFAKYYDIFYKNKKDEEEVSFINNIIEDKIKTILDIGSGTGIHASMLEKLGYAVDLVDLSQEMLEIAKQRTTGKIYNQDLLKLDIKKKYDVIISMFAVINHLKDIDQLEKALINMKNQLNQNGKLIIDLHNPQSSGEKSDMVDNIKRTMKWDYDDVTWVETSQIIYEINNETYTDNHIFKIFTIDEFKVICSKIDLKVLNVFENYTFEDATQASKNIQFVITKM